MTDTPYDAAMTCSKQELARQLVDADARIEALEAALRFYADYERYDGGRIARAALNQSSPPSATE
jgi:hypothetical protein